MKYNRFGVAKSSSGQSVDLRKILVLSMVPRTLNRTGKSTLLGRALSMLGCLDGMHLSTAMNYL